MLAVQGECHHFVQTPVKDPCYTKGNIRSLNFELESFPFAALRLP